MAAPYISDAEAARIDSEARRTRTPALRAPSRSDFYREVDRRRGALIDRDEVVRAQAVAADPVRQGLAPAASIVNPLDAIEGARSVGRSARRAVNTLTGGATGRDTADSNDYFNIIMGIAMARMGTGAKAPAKKKPGLLRRAFGPDARDTKVLDNLKTRVTEARKVFDEARGAEAAAVAKRDGARSSYDAATAAADRFDDATSMWLRSAEDVYYADPTLKPLTDQVIEYANARAGSEAGKAVLARLDAAAQTVREYTGPAGEARIAALHEGSRVAAADLSARMAELAQRRRYEASGYHAPEWISSANPSGFIGKTLRGMAKQGTSKGFGPRILSSIERGIGSAFGDVQGPVGSLLHTISSPGANAVLLDMLALYGVGGYVARKAGWWDPDRNVVDSAEPGKDPAPRVDQIVDAVSFESIRQDYATAVRTNRAAAVQARAQALANMDPAALDAERQRIRSRVFQIHNPGMTLEGLSGSPQGRAFIERFDTDVFGSRLPEDWYTTDLDAYASDVEARAAEGGL